MEQTLQEDDALPERFKRAFVSEDAKLALLLALGLVGVWAVLRQILVVSLSKYPELQKKASILAYLATAMIPTLVLSVTGFAAMHNLTAESTPRKRMLEEAPGSIWACRMQITYQAFSLISAVTVGKPINSAQMILHHIGAGLIGLLSLAPYVQTYSVFYGGFVELSNIPLTYIDLCKEWPYLRQKFPTLFDINRIVFAFIFILLRNILWPYYTLKMCNDLYVLSDEIPMPVIIGTSFCIVSLTTLQFIWGRMIIMMVYRSICSLLSEQAKAVTKAESKEQ